MVSTTYIAAFVGLLAVILPVFGFEVANQEVLQGNLNEVIAAFASLYVFYGRYRAGGVSAFGLRKK